MAKLLSYLGVVCALVIGCQGGRSTVGDSSGLLCPQCVPSAGGQTGDFGGRIVSCWLATPTPVPEEVAQAFALSDALALEGDLDTSLRWERTAAMQDKPYMLTPDTHLHASLALGTPEYRADTACQVVIIPLSVKLETADGSVAGELTGTLSRLGSGTVANWHAHASSDLSRTRGTLDLRIDRGRFLLGQLSFWFRLYPDGPRGGLSFDGAYYDDQEAAEAAAHEETSRDVRRGEPFQAPVRASFPADECGADGEPIELAAPQPWLGMRSVDELLEEFRSQLAASGPADATWRDGSTTGVMLDIGKPEVDVICGTPPRVGFPLTSSLRSADGRVDVELDSAVLSNAPDGVQLSVFQTSVDSLLVARLKLPADRDTGFVFAGFVPETPEDRTANCLVWPPASGDDQPCWKLVPDP